MAVGDRAWGLVKANPLSKKNTLSAKQVSVFCKKGADIQ
jgi:hypothetical protein